MNRRQRVAVAALVTVAAIPAFGIFLRIQQEAAWWQQMRDAQTAMQANQTSFGATAVTGQDPKRLHQHCLDAVNSYDRAAAHLQFAQLDPSTECQP